ncbi:MAG: ABC transporter ATP-binding protein [Lachnospiraceae bacterium]|nr:ABC transporter ATP-binding protein [Lachnospiraceae bacterium]
MLFFEDVQKFVLSDINIHVPQGISLGLIGPSGSGKTTFLKLACGLLKPTTGSIHIMGRIPVKKRRELGSMMGAFFADLPFFQEADTVEGNFRDRKCIYRMEDAVFEKEYAELSERLDFRSFEKEQVKQLSLGQRRRAELGALFLTKPKLLLLDEPYEGLDQIGKDSLRELLVQRQAEGLTFVISSHNMEEISALCDRIALLDQGSLRYYGDRELLLKHFAPNEVMEISFSGNLPDLEDLPLKRYTLQQNKLTLTYNANYVTSAELLAHILEQTTVTAVTTRKSGLADAVTGLAAGMGKTTGKEEGE